MKKKEKVKQVSMGKTITYRVWASYNKRDEYVLEEIYFNRPTTRHTNPDVVYKEGFLIVKIGG